MQTDCIDLLNCVNLYYYVLIIFKEKNFNCLWQNLVINLINSKQ